MLKTLFGAVLAGALVIAGAASAQNFPTRPVTMVIPFAAGGPTDVLGRVVAQRMGEDPRPAGGDRERRRRRRQTGSQRVADAAPDGYTFVLGTVGTHAQGQTLYKKPLYNAADRLHAGRRCIAEVPIVLIVRKDLPASNLQGVRRLRQGEPGQDAVRLGRRRLGDASRLRAAQLWRSAPTSRTCPTAAPARRCRTCGRPHRLPVRDHHDRASRRSTAAPSRRIAIIDQGALAGAAGPADRARAGHRRTSRPIPGTRIFLPKGTPEPIVKKLNDAVRRGDEDAGGARAAAEPRRA